ncbi:hypothetical protein PROFUN_17129, partial [Planoprotostelium fungivorum]
PNVAYKPCLLATTPPLPFFGTLGDDFYKKLNSRSDLALILGVLKRYRSAEESDDPYTMHLWSQIDPIPNVAYKPCLLATTPVNSLQNIYKLLCAQNMLYSSLCLTEAEANEGMWGSMSSAMERFKTALVAAGRTFEEVKGTPDSLKDGLILEIMGNTTSIADRGSIITAWAASQTAPAGALWASQALARITAALDVVLASS